MWNRGARDALLSGAGSSGDMWTDTAGVVQIIEVRDPGICEDATEHSDFAGALNWWQRQHQEHREMASF